METQTNPQKGNLYLIIAIIVGVVAIGATGFASWKYFGGGSEMEKEKSQSSYLPKQEKTIPQIEEQEKIIPSKKTDETANWKTYRNQKYGFEVKYSKDWPISEKEEKYGDERRYLIVLNQIDGQFTFDSYIVEVLDSGNQTSQQFINSYYYEIEGGVSNIKNDIINGQSVVKFFMTKAGVSPAGSAFILFKNNSTIVTISNIKQGVANKIMNDNILNQIASTFKFIETDETANWKTYQNKEYGFEVKYPREAKYSKPKTKGIVFIGKIGEISTSGFGYGITIDVIKNLQNLSAENWYAQYYKNKKEELKDLPFFLSPKGEHTKLNIYSAYKTADFGVDHTDIYYFVSRNNYIYKVHYDEEKANDPNWNQHEEIIHQMLSTFKFTD